MKMKLMRGEIGILRKGLLRFSLPVVAAAGANSPIISLVYGDCLRCWGSYC